MTFTRKSEAIRAAKRLGKRFVLYERTGARNGTYTIGDIAWTEVVWHAKLATLLAW